MKKSRFTDSQILAVLKQAEGGVPVPELCREHGMSSATFYKWRAKYGGMDASLMARLKELEDENRRLKKMYAEERLKAELRHRERVLAALGPVHDHALARRRCPPRSASRPSRARRLSKKSGKALSAARAGAGGGGATRHQHPACL